MYRDGFMCPMAKMLMGETAELLAEKYKISREEQDNFALESQKRAVAAAGAGKFRDEIAAVSQTDKKGKTVLFDADEHVRGGNHAGIFGKIAAGVFRDRHDHRGKFQRDYRWSIGSGIDERRAHARIGSEAAGANS